MSLFENLKSRQEKELDNMTNTKATVDEIVSEITSILGIGTPPKKKVSDYLESAVGWVYACVDAIANEIAGIELKLMRQVGEEVEEVSKHEILDLLSRANERTTEFDLFYLTQQYLDLAGEAPWFLEFKGNKPVNIYLLRPDRISILPPKRGSGDLIGGYTYKVYNNGSMQEIRLEPFEIIFLKYPDPTRTFRGKGTLETVTTTFDIDETAEKFNLKFFANSATPNSVLSTDKKLSKESLRKLKNEMTNKHEGFENSHKTLILEGGLKWESMALTQKEMDFIETMKFTRDKILAVFRVPKSVLGLTEDVNRANAEAGDFVFAKRTIKPKMNKLVQMLNEFLVPFFDNSGDLYLDFEDPVPENVEIKLQTAKEGVAGGILTTNEGREILGYDPVEGGDDVLAPVTPNVEPTKIAGGIKTDHKKKVRVSKHAIRALRRRNVTKRKTKALTEVLVKQISTNVSSVVRSQLLTETQSKKRFNKAMEITKKVYKGSDDQKKQFQNEQIRVGIEFEGKFVKQMGKIFDRQEEIILKKLPEKDDDRLLSVTEETAHTVEKLTPTVSIVIAAQSSKAFQLLGQDNILTRRNENVARYLEEKVFQFSEATTIETNKIIAKVLSDGVKDELGIAKITKNIKDKFASMKGYRAERIARSEIIRATSFATEEAYVVSEVVEYKEWLTSIDERTCPSCNAMNGKKIKLGSDYFKKGDTFQGDVLDYEDIAGPPLHVSCRCTLTPVVFA